jgi:hypothetical protein
MENSNNIINTTSSDLINLSPDPSNLIIHSDNILPETQLEHPNLQSQNIKNHKTDDTYLDLSSHSTATNAKLEKLLDNLKTKYAVFSRSSQYYDRLNLKMICPAILISAFSSIASFMSTSDVLGDDSKQYFGITVGVLTVISTMLQSISGSCSFNTKRDAFLNAADQCEKLITNVEFELEMPDEDKQEFFNKIETQLLEIQDKCKFLPPLFITNDIINEIHKNKTTTRLSKIIH